MELKINQHLNVILEKIKKNDVTIISVPTASGKTLGIPTHLINNGFKVAVTMPRVFLAKSTASIVEKLFKISSNVITGRYSSINPFNKLSFYTEGSFINRNNNFDVLCIDEIHEQNINTEIVLLMAKKFIQKGKKIVLMSATMDISKYVSFFEGVSVSVFEMEDTERKYNINRVEGDIIKYCIENPSQRILIGQDGKENITRTKNLLLARKYPNPIFELHAEIDPDDENNILNYKDDCIIIATSVAMSGMNFHKLDAVAPAIYGKKPNVKGVLESTYLSMAEIKQWEGRTGRLSDGVAIYERLDTLKILKPNVDAEILTAPLLDTYMKLLKVGFDLEKVTLLNSPKMEDIVFAKTVLLKNELITTDDEKNQLTLKGENVLNFDTVEEGLLMIEAKKYGVENTVAKICELIKNGSPFKKQYSFIRTQMRSCPISEMSQHFAVLQSILNDQKLDLGGDKLLLKEYCETNGVIRKSLYNLHKKFNRVDKNYTDYDTISVEILKNVFRKGLNTNIFKYDRNSDTGVEVVTNMYGSNTYCTLTPVMLRNGILVSMATNLD